MTEAEIRLQLAEQEDRAAIDGDEQLHDEVSASTMVTVLLDLEEQQ